MPITTHGSRPTDMRHNETAGAPTVNDDRADGYRVHSQWVDTTADTFYVCTDDTVGAAVWAAAGGGSGLTQAQVLARTLGA